MLTIAILLPVLAAIGVGLARNVSPGDARAAAPAHRDGRGGGARWSCSWSAWSRFDGSGGFEQIESVPWIPSLGVAWKVGVDGLSLPLATMTALIFVVAIAYPVDLRGRAAAYSR